MKSFVNVVLMLLLISLTSMAKAGYDSKCLADCFGTGHECKYCSYQCYNEDYQKFLPNNPPTECPLDVYYRGLND